MLTQPMQTTTPKDGKPVCYNLQVQVQQQAHHNLVRRSLRSQTIAQVEMPVHNPWSAAEIKAALKQDCIEFGDRTGQF
jgi:hypothetical protein